MYKENVKVLQPQAHSLTLGIKASDEFLRHIKITLATLRMSVLEKKGITFSTISYCLNERDVG